MLEHNKNLSSIIGTIQDEVRPSGSSDGGQEGKHPASFIDAVTSYPDAAGQQRSPWRPVFYLMFATLAIVAAFILVMGGREGYQAGLMDEEVQNNPMPDLQERKVALKTLENLSPAGAGMSAADVVAGDQGTGFSNKEIHERQAVIMMQLEELTAAMADFEARNDQHWLDNKSELKTIQDDFQHKLDRVSAVVAVMQQGPEVQGEKATEAATDSSSNKVAQQPDPGSMPSRGGWVVNVASSEHLEPVEKLMKKLGKLGMQAEIQEVAIGGKTRYRLRIPGFATSAEARNYAHALDGEFGLKDPWISSR